MKEMPVLYEIPMTIYPIRILFSFEKDPKKLKHEILSVIETDNLMTDIIDKEVTDDVDNRTFTLNDEDVVIWLRKCDHGIVAHEIFHAATIMLASIGMRLTKGSQEAYAYYIQHVTNVIYTAIKDLEMEL